MNENKSIINIKYNDITFMCNIHNNVYYIDSSNYPQYINNIKKFNILLSLQLSTAQSDIDICLYKAFSNNNMIVNDYFNICNEYCKYTKYDIDYTVLEQVYNNYIPTKNISYKIPKDILLDKNQISEILINEIKHVNNSSNYDHYIYVDYKNPYDLYIRLKFPNKLSAIYQILENIKKKYNYDYIEFKLSINPYYYPILPPLIEYIKPCVNDSILYGLYNSNIFKLSFWTSCITLEKIILHIAYIIESNYNNIIIENIDQQTITYNIIKLSCLMNCSISEYINFDMKEDVANKIKSDKSFWKNGTGYGTNISTTWNINKFIQEQEYYNDEILNILLYLYNNIKDNEIILNDNNINVLFYILNNHISEISLIHIERNKLLYKVIFDILSILIYQIDINKLCSSLSKLYNELTTFIEISNNNDNTIILFDIYTIIQEFFSLNKKKEDVLLSKSQELQTNIEQSNNYISDMKKIQFILSDISTTHSFYNYRSENIDQKSIIRITSEISSMKNGSLPLSWESTIWLSIYKTNYNIFSFIISGPKDTPYENGMFEFHCYLPTNYPNTVPKVLLYTTGNNQVRFNPNLYSNGKVCLSLLDTWKGVDSEKWNPKTSTILQIIISIQSLIFVEEPYFNEPGYEIEIGTEEGKYKSIAYNEDIYLNTIKYAIIDQINNINSEFSNVIQLHFKYKKDEIINNMIKRKTLSTNKYFITELDNYIKHFQSE